MTWAIAGSAAAALAMNMINQGEQKKQQQQEMLANAAQQQYSPWTGMKSGMVGYTGPTAAAAATQGAVGGAMQGIALKKAMSSTPAQPTQQELPKTQGTVGQASTGNPFQPGTEQFNQYEQMMNGQATS